MLSVLWSKANQLNGILEVLVSWCFFRTLFFLIAYIHICDNIYVYVLSHYITYIHIYLYMYVCIYITSQIFHVYFMATSLVFLWALCTNEWLSAFIFISCSFSSFLGLFYFCIFSFMIYLLFILYFILLFYFVLVS